MAFTIEYLEDREALSTLGVDDYKSDLVRIWKSDLYQRNIWNEFGENKLLFIDRERDLWLLFLGPEYDKNADRLDRGEGNPTEDIFLFNYKGKIVEILLKVSDESDEKITNQFIRPFNTVYEFVEMHPSSFDDMDEMGLKKLICEALSMPNSENMKKFRAATYANVPTLVPTRCKLESKD
jgi:hypothetical protein